VRALGWACHANHHYHAATLTNKRMGAALVDVGRSYAQQRCERRWFTVRDCRGYRRYPPPPARTDERVYGRTDRWAGWTFVFAPTTQASTTGVAFPLHHTAPPPHPRWMCGLFSTTLPTELQTDPSRCSPPQAFFYWWLDGRTGYHILLPAWNTHTHQFTVYRCISAVV